MIRRGDIARVDTHRGLRMRRSPAGRQAHHWGEPIIRPYGWTARVTKICTIASGDHKGERWAKFGHYWMNTKYLELRHVESPVPGYDVTYPFGVENSSYAAGFHTGEDRAAPHGRKVVAPKQGVVVRADDNGGAYGNWIQIRIQGHVHVFCHLSDIDVHVGERVRPGERIGNVGSTGNSTGPHLHHEMSQGPVWSYGDVQKPRW